MTNSEFSDALDTLLNSHNVQAGFGEGSNKQGGIALDEYEKSVLLTQAQDIIVKSYFDRTLNSQGQGFDDSTRRQVDFSSLIKVLRYDNKGANLKHTATCYDDRGLRVQLVDSNNESSRILFILNERLEVSDGKDKKTYVVVPINYREYDREMSKAYAQPLKKQAWRLFSNASTGYDIQSEIIPIYGSTEKRRTNRETYHKFTSTGWVGVPSLLENELVKGTVDSPLDLPKNPTVGDIYIVNMEEIEYCDLTYTVRYVERPTPIVLRDLPGNLTIDGYSEYKECSLNPILHMDILNKAFELAVTTRGGGTARQQDTNERQ